MAKSLKLYVKGCCKNKVGIGAYASMIFDGEVETIYTKGFRETTNNRMELLGIIETLGNLQESTDIQIFTENKYVVNSINEKWIDKWVKNNWRNSQRKLIKNVDLWERLLDLINYHNITFIWLSGQEIDIYNVKCDWLVKKYMKFSNELVEDTGYFKISVE